MPAELEDTVAKLERRAHMDQSNSGIPSAGRKLRVNSVNGAPQTSGKSKKKKRILSSRQPSDRKPGGQPYDRGHGRKRPEPDTGILLPVPEEIENSPDRANRTGEAAASGQGPAGRVRHRLHQ